jgi:hypothetical protein
LVPLKGSENVGEISVGDDELMENEPTEMQKEKRTKELENLGAGTFFPLAGTP